jgi:CRISPR-associated endonuclease/helicase Cas3
LIDPLLFWGKATPRDAGPIFHPLVFHALDVAASFEALLAVDFLSTARLEAAFGASVARVVPAMAALVALHDIGKVPRRFQAKSAAAWPPMLGVWAGDPPRYDHAAGSASLLLGVIADSVAPLFLDATFAEKAAIVAPIAFHHGKPCDRTGSSTAIIDATDVTNARDVARTILDVFDSAATPLPPIDEEDAKRLSWLLSGLVSLADWIGSSTAFFPYRTPQEFTPRDYWRYACAKAHDAVKKLRLAPTPPALGAGFNMLFQASWAPSAAQTHCADLRLDTDGPMLVFIEDMTGSGKTESALLLAQSMLHAGKGRGLFVALPTMATANAMYRRMAACYRRMFAAGAHPSLALAHGRAQLHDGFRASILPDEGVATRGVAAEIETVHAACSAFFADDRRKALLADVGVGTIDQALLAVLPTKYATLRQYGLSGKILIIDEAHAYDSYMSREVEQLLTFHAGLGGSAIILSATLPKRMKEAYARAFRGGAFGNKVPLADEAYPLVTVAPMRGAPVETPLAARDDLQRKVGVRRLADSDEALSRIIEAARAGAAVAYIRNSVDDAVEAFDALRAKGLRPILFHARFAMGDRLAIEEKVLKIFGKSGAPDERVGRVLVATQVVEQSLDLDFDLIISDLAPIDLLIQRAGRLWRHARDSRPVPGPDFLVVSPEPVADAGEDWFSSAFPRAAHVYEAHALLWLTAKTLFEAGAIVAPEGVRMLVETVYGAQNPETFPAALRANFDRAEGCAYGERGQADNNLLVFAKGYAADHRGWSDDVNTPTRLGEAQTIFRVALWRDGRLRPYAEDEDEPRAWALSEVSIRAYAASGRRACPPDMERAAAALEAIWRAHGDRAVILPFAGPDNMRVGVTNEKAQEREAWYDAEIGLKVALPRSTGDGPM